MFTQQVSECEGRGSSPVPRKVLEHGRLSAEQKHRSPLGLGVPTEHVMGSMDTSEL